MVKYVNAADLAVKMDVYYAFGAGPPLSEGFRQVVALSHMAALAQHMSHMNPPITF